MSEFKVGDRVKVEKGRSTSSEIFNGRIGKVVAVRNAYCVLDIENKRSDGVGGFYNNELTLIERTTSMTLKQRIEALNNGWDKEADDILGEVIGTHEFLPCVWGRGGGKCGRIAIFSKGPTTPWGDGRTPIIEFSYDNQCHKFKAFKKALLWLLDKSGLEKEAKEGDCAEVEVDGQRFKAKLIKKL